jgi:FkbM family methyltransferase
MCPEAQCRWGPESRYSVRLTDRIGRLMWAGCYEVQFVALLKCALGPGMVFVDVGAHIGYFTTLAACLVGRDGAVYSFEPDPECALCLIGNTHNDPWVIVYDKAVGDRSGEVTLFGSSRPEESGWGTIFATAEARPQVQVPITTLDEIICGSAIKRVDFIKLDVEGAECRVLEGGKQTIATYRPLVFAEVNEVCLARDGKSFRDLSSFFTERTYDIWSLEEKRPESILAIPRERSELLARMSAVNVNLCCLSRSSVDKPQL